MKKSLFLLAFALQAALQAGAQELTLDSCRALALRNNKEISVAKLKQEVALNTRKAVHTKYLPHVDLTGGYMLSSREISILNNSQKNALTNLGTNFTAGLGGNAQNIITNLVKEGVLTADQAQSFGKVLDKMGQAVSQPLNQAGQKVRDAFRSDTRNIFAASVMVTQPIYMGGAITTANKMAEIGQEMAANSLVNTTQQTIYDLDNAYWMVVSLKHKRKLADNYLKLVQKLDDDVNKMIAQGVATKADGLKVSVKVNEAEMTLTQVDNGLSLAKMLLCQLCGLPLEQPITLADEDNENIAVPGEEQTVADSVAMDNRPELKMLQNAVDLSKQSVNLTRAAYLPQIALMGGYSISNPNTFNGFEKKFGGVWNVGVVLRVPVWNWFEGAYKIRASKAQTTLAVMQLEDTREKIELQVSQNRYKVNEAYKKLATTKKNVERADENLRCATLGFKEGVLQTTDVMEAQTAWLQAKTQRIDAEIDLKLSQVGLHKALGILQ